MTVETHHASRHQSFTSSIARSAFRHCVGHSRFQTVILDIEPLAVCWHFACCQNRYTGDTPEVIGCEVYPTDPIVDLLSASEDGGSLLGPPEDGSDGMTDDMNRLAAIADDIYEDFLELESIAAS